MLAASLALMAWGAHALQIASFSPQGEVARVRQMVAKFDAAAVRFGDPKAPAPREPQLQRCRRHPGHGPLDQRARMGLRL
jgi:hypothetical protein